MKTDNLSKLHGSKIGGLGYFSKIKGQLTEQDMKDRIR